MIEFGLLLCTFVIAVNGATLGKIIGGYDAPNHKYPYQVSFRERVEGQPDHHFCSGSILNGKWILTAGHCFYDREIYNVVAVAGTNYLNDIAESYEIDFHIINEQYVHYFHNDICLVRVLKEIKFSDNVKTIRLPVADLAGHDIPAAFAGWGSTQLGGPASNALQEIELQVISNKKCAEVFGITSKHVCTFSGRGKGICLGDSGGPLVANGYQIGIASYVSPCALGYPDVYTRVYPYISWIRRTQMKYDSIAH